MKYLLARLKELSTWRLLAAVAAGVGAPVVSDGVVEAAAQAFSAVVVIYEAFQKDKQ